jgi:hypothetical protein
MVEKIVIIGAGKELYTVSENIKESNEKNLLANELSMKITAPPLLGYSGLIEVEKSGKEKRRLRRKNKRKS